MDYFEEDLEVPFLQVLSEHPTGLPMSEIKKILLDRLNPTGTCAEQSPTRPTEIKLVQRIGNFTPLRERRIFVRGYATYDANTKIYAITDNGRRFLENNGEAFDSLISQGFTREQREREAENGYAGLVIEEGTGKEISGTQRKRSQKLRKIKIEELKKTYNGKLICCVCEFNFEQKYDGLGKDFIHIHHTEPVHEMDIVGSFQKIEVALKKVVPLCANCHNMIHRDRDKLLSPEELKGIIDKQSSSVP